MRRFKYYKWKFCSDCSPILLFLFNMFAPHRLDKLFVILDMSKYIYVLGLLHNISWLNYDENSFFFRGNRQDKTGEVYEERLHSLKFKCQMSICIILHIYARGGGELILGVPCEALKSRFCKMWNKMCFLKTIFFAIQLLKK